MSVEQIAKIEDLFTLEEGQKIVQHKITRLTAPGENYGSLMLRVDVTIQGPRGVEEIKAVAKMIPPNEFIQHMFNTQVTFRNEIGFYKTIVPTLRHFQREHGVDKVIDFFPKYHGSRLNLNHDDKAKVDYNAALVLENLKMQNFVMMERTQGFDLGVAKLVLADLAHLHAVPLALKLQKPQVFDDKVRPFLSTWNVKEESHEGMKRDLYNTTDKMEELKPYLERLHCSFEKLKEEHPVREPFATIAHNDCWINNIMVKVEGGKPVKTNLVDFQVCNYGSPARDVVFFLFTSVKSEVIKEHYDDLIKFYHDSFVGILQELECDASQFSFKAFLDEIDIEAKLSQFGHTIFMLFPVFAPEGIMKDISELSPENMKIEEPTDLHKEKLVFVVNEFVKRNWI